MQYPTIAAAVALSLLFATGCCSRQNAPPDDEAKPREPYERTDLPIRAVPEGSNTFEIPLRETFDVTKIASVLAVFDTGNLECGPKNGALVFHKIAYADGNGRVIREQKVSELECRNDPKHFHPSEVGEVDDGEVFEFLPAHPDFDAAAGQASKGTLWMKVRLYEPHRYSVGTATVRITFRK